MASLVARCSPHFLAYPIPAHLLPCLTPQSLLSLPGGLLFLCQPLSLDIPQGLASVFLWVIVSPLKVLAAAFSFQISRLEFTRKLQAPVSPTSVYLTLVKLNLELIILVVFLS